MFVKFITLSFSSLNSYFKKKKKMDAGIGIGGMNVEREEFVDSKFDLFGKTEYEVGVKKCISQTFRPLTTSSSAGHFS